MTTITNQSTPGPWTWKRMGLPEDDPWYFILNSNGEGPVAEIKYGVDSEAICRANARLIAKAPEMYERLMAEPCGCLRGSAGLTQTCSRCTLIREIDGPIQI